MTREDKMLALLESQCAALAKLEKELAALKLSFQANLREMRQEPTKPQYPSELQYPSIPMYLVNDRMLRDILLMNDPMAEEIKHLIDHVLPLPDPLY